MLSITADCMDTFFSVVIPTLNEEEFLPRLLNDLTKQKEQNFEIIIVDASSHDKTRPKASSFKNNLRLRVYNVKHRNVSFQRNYGAKKAKGSYLLFLDADCRIKPSLTRQLKKQIQKKRGLIFLPYVDPEETSAQVKGFYQFINFLIEASQGTTKPFSSVGSVVWERHFFHLIGGFDESLFVFEDQNIVQKAQDWGVRAKFLPSVKVTFSFRRIKKEGKLQSIYKLFLGTFYTLTKGGIKEKIFDYEMGGHLYQKRQ